MPAIGLLTAPVLARALGPDGRGQLAAILQPLTVADAVAAVGIPTAVAVFVARGYVLAQIRRYAFVVLIGSTLAVYIALVAYSAPVAATTGVPRAALVALWTMVFIGAAIAYRRAVLQGQRRFGNLDLERLLGALLRLGVIIVLAAVGASAAMAFGAGYIAAGVVAAVVSLGLLAVGKRGAPLTSELAVRPANFVKFALLSSVTTISVALNNRLDQAILPSAVDAGQLGFYSIAVTIGEVPLLISVVMNRNLLTERASGATAESLRRTFMVGVGGAIIAAIAIGAVSPWLVPLVFGAEFAPSVVSALVLLGGSVLATAAGGVATLITASGRAGLGAAGPAVGAGASIIGLVAFWSQLSAELASWISLAAQASSLLAALLAYWSLRRISQ